MKDSQKNKAQLIAELEQLRHENAVLKNESELASALEVAQQQLDRAERATVSGNWELHLDSGMLCGTAGAARIYGVSDKQLSFDVLKKVPLPEFRPMLDKALQNLIDKGIAYDVEFKIKPLDRNTILWVRSKASFDADKRILYGNIQDISDYKRVQEALIEMERQNGLLVEYSPDALFQGDAQGTFIRVNSQAQELTGFTEQELLGKKIASLFSKEELEAKPLRFDLLAQGELVTIEREIKRKDGTRLIVEMNSRQLPDQTYISVVRDVSERRRAEEELRKSEEQLRLITDNTSDNIAITTFDKNATYLYVNKSVKPLLGYEVEDLLGHSFFEFVHPKDKKVVYKMLLGYLKVRAKKLKLWRESAFSETIEYRFINKSGEYRYLQTNITLIDDRLLSISRDITDIKQAAKKLAQSEARFRALFENSPAVLLLIDAYSGQIEDVNPAACHFYGWAREQLLKKNISDLNTLSASEIQGRMRQSRLREQNHFQFRHRRSSGEERDVDVYSVPVITNNREMLFSLVLDITERKKFENALYASEQKYRTLFEKSADAVLIIRDGKFVDCNPATVALLRYTNKQDFLNTHPSELSPELQPDGRLSYEKAEEMMDTARRNGSHRFEWDHKKKDGEVFPVEVLLTSIPSEEGDIIHVVWRDITERKESERKLRDNENRMRLIVEGTPNLFFYTQDTNANITYISPSVEKITGCTVDEWKKQLDWFTTDTEQNKQAKRITQRHLAGEIKTGPIHIEIEPQPGNKLFLEVYESPVFENGEVVGLQGVAHDVTQRFITEHALRESEVNFRLLFENSPLGTYIAKPDGKILDVNPALLKILGSPSIEATKQINVLKFPPLVKNGYADRFLASVKEQKVDFFEIPYTSKWGKELFLSSYIVPLVNDQRQVEKVYTIMEDITERKLAEEETEKLEEQLRRSQKMETIGTLAGGIAHDFNNVLAPILGFTELAMLKVKNTEPVARDLRQVLKGVQRAKELVEQILLFSKQTEKERQPLQLSSLVKEALKLLRPSIPATIDIEQLLDENVPMVHADATQLHQVLVNLCTNAWQAMEGGGKLQISLQSFEIGEHNMRLFPNLEVGNYVRLSVSDTGHGMDEATIERIFEPFFTTKPVDKGTGLGLSVVHGIVRSHQGDIHVYSEPGKGTTFQVYLPAIDYTVQIAEEKEEIIRGGTERILIVDDEPAIGEMAQTILQSFGYQADVFTSGSEALTAFESAEPCYDLLLSDLTMPQMTGLDLADHLHRINATLPVIIMTGFGDNLTKDSQTRYGVKRILSKPVAVKDVALAVRSVLDDHKNCN